MTDLKLEGSSGKALRQCIAAVRRGGMVSVPTEEGKLHPNAIISHRMSLEQAAEGYKMFDKKEDNCRKVVLTPGRA